MSDVTRREAQNAAQDLRKLRRNAPTAGQLGRGAVIGAGIGAAAAGLGGLISGTGMPKSPRQWLGRAAGGALFAGGAPYLRHRAETNVKERKIKDYLEERKRRSSFTSKLQRTLGVKVAGLPLTPATRLAKARAARAPRVTAPPGPSVAQVAKPVGYGRPTAGAVKTAFVDELSKLLSVSRG